jgi:ATP-dependent protease ClpP protease subunit
MLLWHERLLCALAVLLAASLCAGDTLTTRDGHLYDGKVLRRNDSGVVFEVHKYGATMRMEFAARDVASISEGAVVDSAPRIAEPDAPAASASADATADDSLPPAPPIVEHTGPTYCVVPMRGEVGKDLVASVLDQALADAVKRKPTVIVLEMDSPGGLIREVEPLIGTIRKYKDTRTVLVVHHAISAAAITALSVPEIYMTPNSIFGAATAFRVMPDGTPQDIEEKMRSVWRAVARNSAEQGGHSPLLASAMIDAKYDLHFDTGRDGKKEIVEGTGSNTVVRQGNLLAMTAPEACACGLAAGTVEDFATLGKLLRVGKWTALECHAPTLMEHRQKAAAQAQKDFDRLDGEFEQNMKDARQSDPSRFKYQAYRDGSLTPESQKQWQERSVPCLKALTAAGQDLDKMAALAQKFPQFLTGADDIRKNKDAVESMKSALRK